MEIPTFERIESLYGKLKECDFKKEMDDLLTNSIWNNNIRINELELLSKDFCHSGKTNTHIAYRIGKLKWANERIRTKNL